MKKLLIILLITIIGGLAMAQTVVRDSVTADANDTRLQINTSTTAWTIINTGTVVNFGYNNGPPVSHFEGYFLFNIVNIPQGMTIDTAYVQFYCASAETADVATTIYFHDLDTAVVPTDSTTWANLALTTANVSWNITADWSAASWNNTPSLKTVVQEIVDRPNWVANSHMAIVLKYAATLGWRPIRARDGDGSVHSAKLYIVYSEGGSPPDTLLNVQADSTHDDFSGESDSAHVTFNTPNYACSDCYVKLT